MISFKKCFYESNATDSDNSLGDDSRVLNTNTKNKKTPPEVEETKLSDADPESSLAVMTACIGCFIGIVLTSFIFLCCNPCDKLKKKRKRYYSQIVSFA